MTLKRVEFLEFEEFEKLMKASDKVIKKTKSKGRRLAYQKLKLAMLLGFGSGLRISEIIGLQREYITKKGIKYEETSYIPQLTADKIDLVKHQIRIDDSKGKKWRVTVTSPGLKAEMLTLLPLNVVRRSFQGLFNRLAMKTLGKRMSFHILRHGFGNYQVNILKMPIPIVQSMMGHADITTTGIYTKANPESAIKMSWEAMGGEE